MVGGKVRGGERGVERGRPLRRACGRLHGWVDKVRSCAVDKSILTSHCHLDVYGAASSRKILKTHDFPVVRNGFAVPRTLLINSL